MIEKIYKRLIQLPKQSFFLFGARGTGKTTLIRDIFKGAKYINLLSESLYQSYLFKNNLFYEELNALDNHSWVIVDEIQRLPQLLNEVHRLIEEKKIKFVLTGSSARKLKKSGVNLLAGRALKRQMHPLLSMELGKDFNLSKILNIGSLPIIWNSSDPKETLSAYVQMYLKEEIQAEAIVRSLPGFARFLPVAALTHGQVVNLSSIARDAEVPRSTVEGYYSILIDTLVGFYLPAFSTKLRVREKKKPKFYFIDPGLVNGLLKLSEISSDVRGHLFEGFIVQSLRALNDYKNIFDDMYYWSPAEVKQTEVDLVLTKGKEVIAIECKSSDKVSKIDIRGLKAISELKGITKKYLVYTGNKKIKIDDVLVLSVEDFFKMLLNIEVEG